MTVSERASYLHDGELSPGQPRGNEDHPGIPAYALRVIKRVPWASYNWKWRRKLRFIPPVLELRYRRRYRPPSGPWGEFTVRTPQVLLGLPGIRCDADAEQASFDEHPLPNYGDRLNYTAPGSSVWSDMQLMCGVVSYSRLIKAQPRTADRPAQLPLYLKGLLATLGALRRLPVGLVLSQARRQDDLGMLLSLDAKDSAGEIRLKSADPAQAPFIAFNYQSPADLPRVLDNPQLASDLLRSRSFWLLRPEVTNPAPDHLRSDEDLRGWVAENLGSAFHSTNSARMGPASDSSAAVGQDCRVHGVEGLRVAQLSIAPRLRRGRGDRCDHRRVRRRTG